jgi:hypothetical protein
VDAILTKIGYPLLVMSAVGLHFFTTITAYGLVAPGWWGYVASVAAWGFPPISEAVVAYYAWRASGSMVNGYSVWVLMWLVIAFGVWWLTEIKIRLERERS